MLALDLDGTVLLPDGNPTPRTISAIAAASRAGYRVCIATGRNYTESRQIISKLGMSGECVFVGGAVVIDTATGKTLHRTAMYPRLAAEVCEVVESMGHAALALQDTGHTGLDYLITGEIPVFDATVKWLASLKMNVEYFPRLALHPHPHTLRVGICCSTRDAAPVLEQLQARFGDRTMMHCLLVPGSNSEVVEVFDPAVSKWEGIRFIARRHQIAPEQIIAVGDDMNDLHMIRHSGMGVAMGNSRHALKEAADLVIDTNLNDGLGRFIDDLLAGRFENAA